MEASEELTVEERTAIDALIRGSPVTHGKIILSISLKAGECERAEISYIKSVNGKTGSRVKQS